MEATICRNCKTFFGCQDGLCSKCFKESKLLKVPQIDPTPLLNNLPKTPEESKETPIAPSGPPDKCFKCLKKLGPINFHCKCGQYFCAKHRHPEDHICTFDHKAAGIRKLSEENPLVEAPKFERLH
jgi:hypothetical protein